MTDPFDRDLPDPEPTFRCIHCGCETLLSCAWTVEQYRDPVCAVCKVQIDRAQGDAAFDAEFDAIYAEVCKAEALEALLEGDYEYINDMEEDFVQWEEYDAAVEEHDARVEGLR